MNEESTSTLFSTVVLCFFSDLDWLASPFWLSTKERTFPLLEDAVCIWPVTSPVSRPMVAKTFGRENQATTRGGEGPLNEITTTDWQTTGRNNTKKSEGSDFLSVTLTPSAM